MPVTLPDQTDGAEFTGLWQLQLTDEKGSPLNMGSFATIDFGAISYKEVLQNVKTILTTPLFSATLERLLGIDQSVVDLPIDAATAATIAVLNAVYFWEPRAEVVSVEFERDVLSAKLSVNVRLKVNNVIYGTQTPYGQTHI